MAGQTIGSIYADLKLSAKGVSDEVEEATSQGTEDGAKLSKKAKSNLEDGVKSSTTAGMKSGLNKASVGILAGAAVIGTGLYKIGESYDNAMDSLRVGTGLTGDALNDVYDISKKISTQVPNDIADIATVTGDLNTRLGLTGDTLETVGSQILELGNISGVEVDIAGVSGALSAFKIEGEGVSGALDYLFQVSQATGVGVNELAIGAANVAPAMQALGFSFQDTAALVGQMDKAGLDSNATMMSMQKGLIKLATDGEAPQEAFTRITAEIQALVDVGDTAAAIDLAGGVFGTKGAVDFVGAVQTGKLNLDDMQGSMGATQDTILGLAEETRSSGESMKIAMNKAMDAIEPLASSFFEGLSDAITKLSPYLDEFSAWFKENQATIKIVAGIVAGLAAGILVMNAGLWLYAGVVKAISIATKIWTGLQWLWNIAMNANPIGIIILAVAALIGIGYLLWKNWDTIWDSIGATMRSSGEYFSSIWNTIYETVGGVISSIGSFFTNLWTGVWDGIIAVRSGIINVITSIWDAVVGFGKGVGNVFMSIVGGIVNGIIWLLNSFPRGINMLFDSIRSFSVNLPLGMGSIGFGWLPTVPVIPSVQVPQLADGGIAKAKSGGQLVQIAEGGYNEAVIPLKPGALDGLMTDGNNGNSGTKFEQTFNINEVGDGESTARKLARQALWTGAKIQVAV